MKIAIISDSHNNEVNLKKVLNFCEKEKIETIIHCGDMASLETLDFMNDNFSGNILYTFGNADYDDLQNYKNIQVYRNTEIHDPHGEIEIDDNPVKPDVHGARKIAFVHFPEKAQELAQSGKYTHVFYGHTHKPWTEKVNKCILLNPGTLAGEIYPPTFAVWNTESDKFELIRIDELK